MKYIFSDSEYTNARILHYPTKDNVIQVASKLLFRRNECPSPPPKPRSDKPKVSNPERSVRMSKQRALSNVQKILDCNSFTHFITLTLDPSKIDRNDPKAVYSKVKTFLDNASRRHNFTYLLIPAYGPKGDGIHLHGVCNIGTLSVKRATYDDGSPVYDKMGRDVFNVSAWKWGYSHVTAIDGSVVNIGNYCKGHIEESNGKVFGKWYLSSRNLVRGPEIELVDSIDFEEFRDQTKIDQKQQFETKIYDGFSIISEEVVLRDDM